MAPKDCTDYKQKIIAGHEGTLKVIIKVLETTSP